MNVFDLAAKLSLDSSEYESGLDGASKSASNFGSKLKSSLATGAKVAAGAVAVVGAGIVAGGKGLVDATGELASYGDEIDKNSQKLGVSAEFYQEWEAVLQHSGTSMSSMTTTFKTLSKAVQDGSEDQMAAFDQLGLSMDELKEMSTEEVFAATVAALQEMEEGTERTTLASTLLGKGAMELGALLNTSAEDTQGMIDTVHELGGVLSNEAVKSAAAYQDSLQDMQTSFSGLKNNLVSEFLPGLTTVMDGLTAIVSGDNENGFAAMSAGIDSIITQIDEKLPAFVEAGITIIESIATAIVENLPKIAESGVDIILRLLDAIVENLPTILDAGVQILIAIINGIVEAIPKLVEKLPDVINAIVDFIDENLPLLIDAGIKLFVALVEALPQIIAAIVEAIPKIITAIVDAFKEKWPEIKEAGKKIMQQVVDGFGTMHEKIKKAVSTIGDKIKEAFKEPIDNAKNWGKDLIDNFVSGITNTVGKVKDTISNVAGTIKDFLGFSEPEKGPLSNFHTYAPDMMELFAKGILDNEHVVTNAIGTAFDFGTVGSIGGISSDVATGTANDNLVAAIQEALEGYSIKWDDRNLGRLVRKYA